MTMRYTIEQNDDGSWSVCEASTDTLVEIGGSHPNYDVALAALGAQLAEMMDDGEDDLAEGDGLLPDSWTSDKGICFAELLPGGRDFTECDFSWRDPAVSLVPLMLLQETSEGGHLRAQLAGYVEQFTGGGVGIVGASGRFYDNDAGEAFRDLLLGGRRFGVSVDPSEDYSCQFVCTEMDEDGFCTDGVTKFMQYEIAGLTGCPFPAFEQASIVLDGPPATTNPDEPAEPMARAVRARAVSTTAARAAAGRPPLYPPDEWFDFAEPAVDSPLMIEQGGGRFNVPLTITDEGQVFGHLASWGQCYLGSAPGQCIEPPVSETAYAHFHVGSVLTASGRRVSAGTLTIGCDHADELTREGRWLSPSEARDHYANAGLGWANVRCSNGEHGPWLAGRVTPDITIEQLAILRSLTLSGDWRLIGGNLELIGALAVIAPGFPISREAITASAMSMIAAAPMPRQAVHGGVVTALVAAGQVARCVDCAARRRSDAGGALRSSQTSDDALSVQLAQMRSLLTTIELRTRHLNVDAAAALRTRLSL